MQPPNSSKTSLIKKWLPAIIFAILLHLIVVLLLFITHQKKETHSSLTDFKIGGMNSIGQNDSEKKMIELDNTAVDTLTKISSKTDFNPEEVIDTHSETNMNTSNQDRTSSSSLTNQTNKNLNEENVSFDRSTQSTPNTQNHLLQKKKESDIAHPTTPKIESSSSRPLSTTNKNEADRQNNSSEAITENSRSTLPLERPIQTVENNKNPNDDLLLPRDLPKSTNIESNTTTQYNQALRETEEINEKLSQTINEIKRQKMQEIEAQKERQRDIYMQDKAIKTNEDVNKVSRQLEVDKLAEEEFRSIADK